MNWISINRKSLAAHNYVRKANAKTNYWLDLSDKKIKEYKF